ncbi:uncharacterized protein DUF2156 [Fontibacillus phaseoli]|uniref:Uncharacterized protein DUF2156 n=1 Tax=Fontibacillus phaseoli TaxID=1416533 RepID=A0A369BGJ0_9BACL|nr:uncharacterized protein DUF2156 [Fontibacillus phaseoli]
MDVLFATLFKWAQAHHYAVWEAPLTNVSDLLIARWIHQFGNRWYNFKGLYDYKNKFAPGWREGVSVFLLHVARWLSWMYMVHTPAPESSPEAALRIAFREARGKKA